MIHLLGGCEGMLIPGEYCKECPHTHYRKKLDGAFWSISY